MDGGEARKVVKTYRIKRGRRKVVLVSLWSSMRIWRSGERERNRIAGSTLTFHHKLPHHLERKQRIIRALEISYRA